jgi:alpha-L-arabinofuranosidase
MVTLMPGPWGRLASSDGAPLTTRAETALALKEEGLGVIRMGGSMTAQSGYTWKEFTPRPEERQPYQADWLKTSVSSRGWGMFECVDMCEALGVLPIIDLRLDETSEDMADLVDWLYGDGTTVWGARRIAAGHPKPFNLTHFEFGNEQAILPAVDNFGRIVRAIEGRKALRPGLKGLNFSYIIGACKGHTASPTGCGTTTKNDTEAMIAEVIAMERDGVVPSNRVFWDVHSPVPTELAIEVQNYTRLGSRVRTVVLEENGITHNLARALSHARLNNAYQRLGEQVVPIAGYVSDALIKSLPSNALVTCRLLRNPRHACAVQIG